MARTAATEAAAAERSADEDAAGEVDAYSVTGAGAAGELARIRSLELVLHR